jgi:hypothetical protein
MFGHNPFVWTPISTTQLLGADTFAAEQVTNPCNADYLITSNGKKIWWKVTTDNGHYFESKWTFSGAATAHTFMQSGGYGNKYALVSDYEALSPEDRDCPLSTSGRSVPTWPYDENAVIVVKYKDNKWGYFRAKSASSRGLAGGWFTGSEAAALAKSYVTSNYVILDAGECNFGSFAVNLTPEEILGKCQECAAPSNCAVSTWSAWSSCSNGTRTRTRTITNPQMNGGTACPSLTETGSCTPSNGDGTPDIIPCADANRNTAADGSCDTDCLTGYEFDSNNNCVAVSATNGGNGDDPNDCATANRAKNTDDTCGDCKTGYSEDTTTGLCVADVADEEDAPNYLLYGGIAVVAVIGFSMMS